MILGLLAERQFGRVRLFINGENLTGVRQTRWDPLLRPDTRGRRPLDRRCVGAARRPQRQRRPPGSILIALRMPRVASPRSGHPPRRSESRPSSCKPFVLQPGTRDVFRNFVIPVPITTTRYVRAVEFRADRPQVLHHADLAVDCSSPTRRRRGLRGGGQLRAAGRRRGRERVSARALPREGGTILKSAFARCASYGATDFAWRRARWLEGRH